MRPCINLKKQFPQHRITYDPACEDKHDPWTFQIPCRLGTIYPHGDDRLAVEVDYHPSAVRKLAALPGLYHYQYGDGEHTFVFHLGSFSQVAEIVKPRKKKTISPAYREKLVASLKKRKKPQTSQ